MDKRKKILVLTGIFSLLSPRKTRWQCVQDKKHFSTCSFISHMEHYFNAQVFVRRSEQINQHLCKNPFISYIGISTINTLIPQWFFWKALLKHFNFRICLKPIKCDVRLIIQPLSLVDQFIPFLPFTAYATFSFVWFIQNTTESFKKCYDTFWTATCWEKNRLILVKI